MKHPFELQLVVIIHSNVFGCGTNRVPLSLLPHTPSHIHSFTYFILSFTFHRIHSFTLDRGRCTSSTVFSSPLRLPFFLWDSIHYYWDSFEIPKGEWHLMHSSTIFIPFHWKKKITEWSWNNPRVPHPAPKMFIIPQPPPSSFVQ